jgi:hypothetical protein
MEGVAGLHHPQANPTWLVRISVDLISPLNRGTGSAALSLCLVPPEETVESLLLTASKLAALNARMVDTKEGIDVVHGLRSDVGELLDLSGDVLDLVIVEGKAKLFDTRLDGVPTRQTVTVNGGLKGGDFERGKYAPNRDVAGKTEVLRLEDLVRAGVVEDGLGVDASLVGEGTVPGDRVHEGDVDLDGLSDQVLDFSEHGEVVLGLDVFGVGGIETGDEATERGDTDTLTNTEDGGIDVGGTSLKSSVGVGNGHTRVIVEMDLDVARNDTAEGPDQVIDLAGVGAANSVSDADTVDTNLIYSLVDREEIDEI